MRAVGGVAGSTPVTGAVAMKPRDASGLQAFAAAVSTTGSSLFHHYITPADFAQRFGPTATSLAGVAGQLRRDGLKVGAISANGLLVPFSGSTGQVSAAFHTKLERVRLADGSIGMATTSSVELPAAVASSVATVVGLDNLVHAHPVSVLRPTLAEAKLHAAARAPAVPAISGAPTACPAAQQAATTFGGLTDSAIAHSYGVDGLYRAGDFAASQSVAIYELEPFLTSDIQAFDTCYFGATAAAHMLERLHTVPVDGGQQVGSGSGEAVLDVQDVSAIAPGATIYVYQAPNTEYGGLDEYNQIVSQDKAQQVTSSWGLCETAVQTGEPGVQALENVIFQEAAAQGESVFAAAGDDGSNDCAGHASSPVAPVLSVDDPASQPYVVSVGGTTIDNATQPPLERVWNDGASWGAGGGGLSDTWTVPSWQKLSTVPGVNNATVIAKANAFATSQGFGGGKFCLTDSAAGATASGCRQTPDVSAQADEFTGAITVYAASFGGWTTIGGTSSATPLWAAMTAEINASHPTGCSASSFSVGFISPLLYTVASNPTSYAASFNDIVAGNNDIFGVTGGLFTAAKGYDMASGLGSPKLTGPSGTGGLSLALCALSVASPAPRVTSISPTALPTGGGQVTVTGSGFTGTGVHLAYVQVGSVSLPPSAVTNLTATSFDLAVPSGSVLSPPLTPNNGAGGYHLSVIMSNGLTSKGGPNSVVQITGAASGTLPVVTGVGPSGGPESAAFGSSPVTTTVYGAGFTGASKVTFGGVSSPRIAVNASGTQITATVPAYQPEITSCAQGDFPRTDVCQTQVVVTTGSGSSADSSSTILPPYSGPYAFNNQGVVVPPAGCNCETAPQSTEFDYLPAPRITGLTMSTTNVSGQAYASESGTTTVTLHGVGFDVLGFEWLDLGGVANQYSSLFFAGPTAISGTEIQFSAPAIPATPGQVTLPAYVQTLASPNSANISAATPTPSNGVGVRYAPTPVVTKVSTGTSVAAGPSTGGTTLTITGRSFGAADVVTFTDQFTPFGVPFSSATSLNFRIVSTQKITLTVPGANPGIDNVQVCTPSGCSKADPKVDTFIYYAPYDPAVTKSSPASGSAKGGTSVTITGVNLGFVVGVRFGSVAATKFANAPALLDSGSTTTVVATAPAGKAGSKVSITVETLQSLLSGRGFTKPVAGATFTYAK